MPLPIGRRRSERIYAKQHEKSDPTSSNFAFRVLVYLQGDGENTAALKREALRSANALLDEPQFHYFTKLPLVSHLHPAIDINNLTTPSQEIQHEIIEYALPGPRVIEFFCPKKDAHLVMTRLPHDWVHYEGDDEYEKNKKRCCLYIYTPALLHVNRNTRAYCLRVYYPALIDYLEFKNPVYVRFESDTILVPFRNDFYTLFDGFDRQPVGQEYWRQIQHLAIPDKYAKTRHISPRNFPALKSVTFIDGDNYTNHLTAIPVATFSKKLKQFWVKECKLYLPKTISSPLKIVYLSKEGFKKHFSCDGYLRYHKGQHWLEYTHYFPWK